MYVCMYVCMYVYIYIYTYMCVCVCVCVSGWGGSHLHLGASSAAFITCFSEMRWFTEQ